MRILFLTPKILYPDLAFQFGLLPQGQAYVAGALKAAGHDVVGFNLNLYGGLGSYAEQRELLIDAVNNAHPDIVALGGLSGDYRFIKDSMAIVRRYAPHTPVILGGGIISSDPEFIFNDLCPDFAVIGEAELSIIELVDCIRNSKKTFELINGIAYWKNGVAVFTEVREANHKLDLLPYPDYEHLEIETYFKLNAHTESSLFSSRSEMRMMPVTAARSCPFKCTFCYHPLGQVYRKRSIDNVIEEIIFFYNKYKINTVKFYDELFSSNHERVYEFCEKIKALKIDLDWNCSLRVTDISEDLLKTMKESGCTVVGYGFESASNEILKSMKKMITKADISHALDISEKVGIGVLANFIFGDVAETEETLNETNQFYREYCLDKMIMCSYIYPFPGAPIFTDIDQKGLIPNRKEYYNNIHKRPKYNMTSMSGRAYYQKLNKILANQYDGIKKAINPEFELKSLPDSTLILKHRPGLSSWNIKATCPHCKLSCDYIYDFTFDLGKFEGRLQAIEPQFAYCQHCRKRYLVSTLQLAGSQDSFGHYMSKINQLNREPTQLFVGPVVGKRRIEILKFYGLDLQELNVAGFFDRRCSFEGTMFEGYPLHPLDNEHHLNRYGQCKYLILPDEDQQSYIDYFKSIKVQPDQFIYIID